MLLDITFSTSELLTMIGYLTTILVAIIMLFGVVIGILHKQMLKRLDLIDFDLKPLISTVAVHTEQIKEIREDVDELKQWQGHYDGRIQRIERHPALK